MSIDNHREMNRIILGITGNAGKGDWHNAIYFVSELLSFCIKMQGKLEDERLGR